MKFIHTLPLKIFWRFKLHIPPIPKMCIITFNWPFGPRWAPCWPHELCYQGFLILTIYQTTISISMCQRNIPVAYIYWHNLLFLTSYKNSQSPNVHRSTHVASQRTREAIITSSSRQNEATTSFWRNNDVVVASCVRWDKPYHIHWWAAIGTEMCNLLVMVGRIGPMSDQQLGLYLGFDLEMSRSLHAYHSPVHVVQTELNI